MDQNWNNAWRNFGIMAFVGIMFMLIVMMIAMMNLPR